MGNFVFGAWVGAVFGFLACAVISGGGGHGRGA